MKPARQWATKNMLENNDDNYYVPVTMLFLGFYPDIGIVLQER
jgi:hypothetical protein